MTCLGVNEDSYQLRDEGTIASVSSKRKIFTSPCATIMLLDDLQVYLFIAFSEAREHLLESLDVSFCLIHIGSALLVDRRGRESF